MVQSRETARASLWAVAAGLRRHAGRAGGRLRHLQEPDKPLFVDHSHATGKVRGLLCRPCNFSLGFMRDDPRLTAAATEYLLKAAARDDKPK
jgi:hypothetical protein